MKAVTNHSNADLDKPRPLSAVSFPGNPHSATIWRWKSKGITKRGRNIRLKTIVCGGRCFTTQRWADEFVAACNADTYPNESGDYLSRAKSEAAALKAVLS